MSYTEHEVLIFHCAHGTVLASVPLRNQKPGPFLHDLVVRRRHDAVSVSGIVGIGEIRCPAGADSLCKFSSLILVVRPFVALVCLIQSHHVRINLFQETSNFGIRIMSQNRLGLAECSDIVRTETHCHFLAATGSGFRIRFRGFLTAEMRRKFVIRKPHRLRA